MFGALIEEATLAKRMRSWRNAHEDARALEAPGYKTKTLEREAEQMSEWLHEIRGLVEPEGPASSPWQFIRCESSIRFGPLSTRGSADLWESSGFCVARPLHHVRPHGYADFGKALIELLPAL